ncbi:MAG: hypothetical protein JST55_15765 [Bacteroidetes bacterium]|nr:hypothetical protein [Bacteroidota bacterium]
MKSPILHLTVLLLIFTGNLFSPAVAQNQNTENFSGLEGKKCKIQIVNKIKFTEKKTDVLTFSLNDFNSELCKNGDMNLIFKNIFADKGIKYFLLEFKSEHNQRIMWEGQIEKNKLNGTMTFINGNKIPISYLFEGEISK